MLINKTKKSVIRGIFIAFLLFFPLAMVSAQTASYPKVDWAAIYKNTAILTIGAKVRTPVDGVMVTVNRPANPGKFASGEYKEGSQFALALQIIQINSQDGVYNYYGYAADSSPNGQIYLVQSKGRIEKAVRYCRLNILGTYQQNFETTTTNDQTGETKNLTIPVFSIQQAYVILRDIQ